MMQRTDQRSTLTDIRQQIRQTLDREWQQQGASPEELELSRRINDLFAYELATGRTPAEIEAAWAGKPAAEILSEYAQPLLDDRSGS